MLEAVQDVHGAVLDPVLVAGDQAAAHLGIVRPLALLVELPRMGVEALDEFLGLR
ncbi:hypothetical protein D3C84_1316160 [compost metagenome]